MKKTFFKTRFLALMLLVLLLVGCVSEGQNINSSEIESFNADFESFAVTEDAYSEDRSEQISEASEAEESKDTPAESEIALHFLDVGQADAILVQCDGKAMLVDGGNSADSSLLYTYLKKQGVNHLEYLIATHAHEDHVGGLAGALNYATVGKVFCPVTAYESNAFNNFVKYVERAGSSLTVPKVGDSFALGSATVQIIGVNSASDTNNTSIVAKITHGETTFLLTGDAEREAEQVILDSGYDLKCTLLKVGHHGSDSSTTYPFLREAMPEYAVISVGTGNVYGHPHDGTLSKLRDAGVSVYRTDISGTVLCRGNGKTLSFSFPDKESSVTAPVVPPEEDDSSAADDDVSGGTAYILNTNTKKFHYPSCQSVKQMADENKEEYQGNREDLISNGYSSCGICKP